MLISGSLLGFEITLMRLLLVAGWHHFVFLVISVVLLGFGASGTLLTLARGRFLRNAPTALPVLALCTAVSMPLAWATVQQIPLEAEILPSLLPQQVGAWVLSWAVLALPILLGGTAIGLALMVARERLPRVYAGNLLGGAAGAMLAPLVMTVAPPSWLPALMGLPALMATLVLLVPRTRLAPGIAAAALLAAAVAAWLGPPSIRLDPVKYGARLAQLQRQGEVERVAWRHGPRALVEAWRGDVLHDLPFLATGAAAPPISVLTLDGHWAGSVLDLAPPEAATVVEQMVMSVPYALAPKEPRVALLGEVGGANAHLAASHGARSIDWVQPNGNILELLGGPLQDRGGSVLNIPAVTLHVTELRHFIEHTPKTFDLVQIVPLETMAAGSGGAAGLAQDYLVTVEGLVAVLEHLGGEGLLAVTRGIQEPPRDNLKLMATIAEALRRTGIETPGAHIVILRDYLAVCTIARRSPWTADEIEGIRALAHRKQLTPVWFSGIREDELNAPDALPGPEGGPGDWYHHAARSLLGGRDAAEAYMADWAWDIRPPTDARPFFRDFARLGSLHRLREAFGDLWLTRIELGYPLVLAALAATALFGGAAILLPLMIRGAAGPSPGRSATLAYFTAIGLGYMLFEILVLSRATLLVGDPVGAAAVTIGGFLFFSGLGSLAVQRWRPGRSALRGLMVALLIVGIVTLVALPMVSIEAASLPLALRVVTALVVLAPLAFLMGFPAPEGLARLDRSAPAMVGWAWGINGFASVIAGPLAIAVAMAWGFLAVGVLALGCYAVASVLSHRLPGTRAAVRGGMPDRWTGPVETPG
jgi:hypothetical protein